jgi:E3 ubiquitin-protein ligase BRE1
LIASNKRLAQFHSTFGESSQLPHDVRQLVEQLKLKEEEVKVLRLQDAQHADAETALYDEIGKLSAAWESLQVQVTSKVFELAATEERIMKANLDVGPTVSQRHAWYSSHPGDAESQGGQQVLCSYARERSCRK